MNDTSAVDLDYSILEKHKVLLDRLARMSNCGISVFDMHRQRHVFTSYNFSSLFGYDLDRVEESDVEYINALTHPDDLLRIERNGRAAMAYLARLGERELTANTKLISEYRIRSGEGYTRVIEQFCVLEFDPEGNIWLSLSVMDVSPNQAPLEAVHSKLMNCLTGEVYQLPEFSEPVAACPLSEREKDILRLVRDGMLSKEISGRLAISVHTVNTHRQRILEKLDVDNSMEAVRYASRYGLLD